ncbi:hypothetical protein QZH41_004191 [Actinostola sp. cb2023]|nr:hypothetical protein QZH41_004191 [Actinostola sp. cb2023]
MEDGNRKLRKVIVGEQDPFRPFQDGKVLMLVGATGTGKSTLINGFVNYIRRVPYEDKYRYKLVDDGETRQSEAHSQTQWITAYTFQKHDQLELPYTFTIIDTPGYGDTQGLDRDKQITKQIKEFFSLKGKQGVDHLDGIGFVVNASLCRLSPTQKYIFDAILSIFGKDFKRNIFLMVTFADAKKPPVLAAIKESGFEYQKMFKFNNSALFPDDSEDTQGDDDDDDDDDDDSHFNAMFWKMGEKNFGNFFKEFGQTKSVSLQLTNEVLNKREQLECLVQGLQVNIQAGLSIVDHLDQEKRVLKLHEKDMETNKDFTYEIEETRQRKVDLDDGVYVTNCLKCNFTCHYPCIIPKDEDKSGCAAMVPQSTEEANCVICTMQCHWTQHVNNMYRFEFYMVEVQKTSNELKSRYIDAKGKKTQKERILAGLEKDLEDTNAYVYLNVSNAKNCIERLDEIALRPNPMTEVGYIDILIQSEKMEAKTGWTRRVEALSNVRQQAEVLSTVINSQPSFVTRITGAVVTIWKSLTGGK